PGALVHESAVEDQPTNVQEEVVVPPVSVQHDPREITGRCGDVANTLEARVRSGKIFPDGVVDILGPDKKAECRLDQLVVRYVVAELIEEANGTASI